MERFACIDIGTNSIRLAIVQPEPGGAYSVLSQQKEVVRLGEGEFVGSALTDAAMQRALLVCRQFADAARAQGAGEMQVVATAALREATNRQVFLRRARREAGLDVRVISGNEEARLIYLGVVSGLELDGQRVLVIDIGGGSTELGVGDSATPAVLESMKLGAIRLANLFTEGITGPVPAAVLRQIENYVDGVAVHSVQRVSSCGYDQVFGSSGTILNLVEIVARRRGETTRTGSARLEELRETRDLLAGLPLALRRRVPGINPDRADIIVAGATILVTLLDRLGAREVRASDRALREGMIVDHLMRADEAANRAVLDDSVRARSVLQLVRRCQADERHARAVTHLALRLFDELAVLGLLEGAARARELLQYAALLHDAGGFISYTDHHRHGWYLVRNSPLLGFDATEIAILAALVLHHRKALPKRKSEATRDLSVADFRLVERLSMCLRLAESLERGHVAAVRDVACRLNSAGVVLELSAAEDPQLALWGLESQREAFRSVFGEELEIRARAGGRADLAPA